MRVIHIALAYGSVPLVGLFLVGAASAQTGPAPKSVMVAMKWYEASPGEKKVTETSAVKAFKAEDKARGPKGYRIGISDFRCARQVEFQVKQLAKGSVIKKRIEKIESDFSKDGGRIQLVCSFFAGKVGRFFSTDPEVKCHFRGLKKIESDLQNRKTKYAVVAGGKTFSYFQKNPSACTAISSEDMIASLNEAETSMHVHFGSPPIEEVLSGAKKASVPGEQPRASLVSDAGTVAGVGAGAGAVSEYDRKADGGSQMGQSQTGQFPGDTVAPTNLGDTFSKAAF